MATEIVPGVIQKRLAHSKVVYLPDEQLLIDTAPETEWNALQSFLNEYSTVDTVFLSHAHGDHVGNVDRVKDAYDPEFLYPTNEPLDDVPLSEEDVTRVSDGDEIANGLEVIEVPGHTPGICGVFVSEHNTLLATDVLDGADRRGMPAGYLVPPPAMYNWDTQQAETNIEKLLDYDFETAVVTHGTNVESDARLKLDKYLNFPDYYRKDLLE